ncbi:class B sortase [Adlercreutzia sp. ZJ304]|uniref:class B sortase n=1 Tax=Adlercreutzia sp. ZJ304 TaxID=2709791 RepID=UPI0013ED81B8|nr:class B sortase [Adlercreutzia sp. ZJ304]
MADERDNKVNLRKDASSRLSSDHDLKPRHVKGASASLSKRGLRRVLTVALVVLVAVVVCVAGFLIWQTIEMQNASNRSVNTPVPATTNSAEQGELPDNPINFAELQSENEDTYAWIYIPGTSINLAVYQSSTDDTYYLKHDRYGNYADAGEVFSQSINGRDFFDPVTVLYGHNYSGDIMFTQLHYFEDKEFFDTHENFYIYTPGHILTYEVVSAYQYDDRHIMNSFDFSDDAVKRSYFDYVMNPDSLVRNVREGAMLADDDKIVQLSTCTSDGNNSKRYIVTGVLVDDQLTK